jgi:alpha-L-fucosidase
MLEMGEWLDVNGASIYGAEAFDLPKDQHDWGKITYKEIDENTHRLYLHVFNWPFNHQLPLTGVITKPRKAYILRDKLQSPLDFSQTEIFTNITLPAAQPDQLISVVVLEYDSKPMVAPNFVAKTVDGGFSLKHENIISEVGTVAPEGYNSKGTIPPHIVISDNYQSSWKIFIDQPGDYIFDVSYSFQGEKPAGKITINAAKTSISHEVAPTGLTVAEPNRKYHIDNFASHRVGSINFQKAGIYEISMEIKAKKEQPVKFQWMWVKNK